MNNPSIKQERGALFCYLTLLTMLFICLQVSYLLSRSGFYLGDIQSMTRHLTIPHQVIAPILFFISVQVVIHLLFIIWIWMQSQFIGIALHLSWRKTEKIAFYLWGVSIATIIFGNQYYFPNAKFSGLTAFAISHLWAGVLFYLGFVICGLACLIAIWGCIKTFSKSVMMLIMGLLVSVAIYPILNHSSITVTDASSVNQPNIIIIGIDSLRPDYLGYAQRTPHLDNFLSQSTMFTKAMTPIARTFPSWVSILTGQYPKQSGARTNLEDIHHINQLDKTLPNILRQHGYETVFATDETRFSNIDHQYGFNKIITPPIGFNDFLLGTINDFPLSNALVNTRLGHWLFPNSYGSRPVAATYDPDSFLKMIKPELEKSRSKPLFMAIHFCLPHTPYYWGTEVSTDDAIVNYKAAIHRVDKQFYDFMQLLTQNKILKHAIVVLLSDHGEALELHGDRVTYSELFIAGASNHKKVIPRFYPPTMEKEPVDKSVGHGTDVLGLPQYHSVLAFRLFGLERKQSAVKISGVVSLLDIKPTLLGFLKYNYEKLPGTSLEDAIVGKKLFIKHEDFFMETDFSPESIRSVHPETRDVVFEGINYFQIDPATTRLVVKKSMENLIISSKQYANLHGQWILALYPQTQTSMMPILVNLKTGEWTNDLRTPFAIQSPANHMLQALQKFYGKEITKIT